MGAGTVTGFHLHRCLPALQQRWRLRPKQRQKLTQLDSVAVVEPGQVSASSKAGSTAALGKGDAGLKSTQASPARSERAGEEGEEVKLLPSTRPSFLIRARSNGQVRGRRRCRSGVVLKWEHEQPRRVMAAIALWRLRSACMVLLPALQSGARPPGPQSSARPLVSGCLCISTTMPGSQQEVSAWQLRQEAVLQLWAGEGAALPTLQEQAPHLTMDTLSELPARQVRSANSCTSELWLAAGHSAACSA